jgi:hypothetical protein
VEVLAIVVALLARRRVDVAIAAPRHLAVAVARRGVDAAAVALLARLDDVVAAAEREQAGAGAAIAVVGWNGLGSQRTGSLKWLSIECWLVT